MEALGFTVNPSGEWSERQLKAVLKIIEPEAEEMGLEVNSIEVTTYSTKEKRFIVTVRCKKHQEPLSPDSACPVCKGLQ